MKIEIDTERQEAMLKKLQDANNGTRMAEELADTDGKDGVSIKEWAVFTQSLENINAFLVGRGEEELDFRDPIHVSMTLSVLKRYET